MIEYIKKISPHFDHIQNSIKLNAKKYNVPIIKDDTVLYLISVLSMFKPLNILELGSGFGYSTYLFSKYSNPETKIISVDFSMEAIKNSKELLSSSKYVSKIDWIHCDGLIYLQKERLNDVDLFFIDAKKEDYYDYFNTIIAKAKSNSIIIFDNLYLNGDVNSLKSLKSQKVHLLNCSLFNNKKGIFTFLPIGDGIGLFVIS